MHNLPPPLTLIEEYNNYNRMYGKSAALLPYYDTFNKNSYFVANPRLHMYDTHFDPITGHHYSSEIHHEIQRDPFHTFDEFDDHIYPHHLVRNIYEHRPVYDEFGREIIYPTSPFVPGIVTTPGIVQRPSKTIKFPFLCTYF